MAKFNLYKLSLSEQQELLDRFFRAVTSLGSLAEVRNFFKDLLHPQEMTMLAQRLKVAEMLLNQETYNEIARKLRVGQNTIAKVHRWVNSERGGYKIAVKQLQKLDKRKQGKVVKEEKALHYGWERVKKIYPTIDKENIEDVIDALRSYIRQRKRKKSLDKK